MKKNTLFYLAFPLLLSLYSCNKNINYKNFVGPMVVSHVQYDYSKINNHLTEEYCSDKLITTINNYYYNLSFLYTTEEVNDFYKQNPTTDESEIALSSSLQEDRFQIFFAAQIPKGYKVIEKNPNQQTVINNSEELVTDNFYYYVNRPSWFYCILNLAVDETIEDSYSYCFFYQITDYFKEKINDSNVKFMLNITS